MAYVFDGTGDGFYYDLPSTYTTSANYSMCIWFKTTYTAGFNQLCSYYNAGNEVWQFCFNANDNYSYNAERLMFAYRGDYIGANDIGKQKLDPGGVFDGEWHCLAISKTSGTAHPKIYLDGADGGFTVSAGSPDNDAVFNFDTPHAIGGQSLPYDAANVNDNFHGSCAEYAFWDTNLTDEDVAMLYHTSPLMVRRDKLIWYVPCIADRNDPVYGASWSDAGDATVEADHPPILRPQAQIIPFPPAAVVAGSYTIYNNYYRQLLAGNV